MTDDRYAWAVEPETPDRCTCDDHQHRPDVYEPDVCTVEGCHCEVRS